MGLKKTRSLQKKVLILLAVLVLPMNIVSLLITNVMLQDARKSVMNSIQATVKTYAEQMEQLHTIQIILHSKSTFSGVIQVANPLHPDAVTSGCDRGGSTTS